MTERERLVELIRRGEKYFMEKYINMTIVDFSKLHSEFLADYLLQNGVTAPVVRKGQFVYIHQFDNNNNKVPVKCTVESVDGEEFTLALRDGRRLDLKLDFIGKTVFLTREEAEKALQTMKDIQ